MKTNPERVFSLVTYLAQLGERLRPFGLMFEEPRGETLPEECGRWAAYIRKVMDANNWKGRLLAHIHQKWGFCDATAIEASNFYIKGKK